MASIHCRASALALTKPVGCYVITVAPPVYIRHAGGIYPAQPAIHLYFSGAFYLTPHMKKALRAQAHALKPVVITGQAGVSEAVLAEIDNALNHHELIKVRLRNDDREQRREMAQAVCTQMQAELIQTMGQIATLYRKKPETR